MGLCAVHPKIPCRTRASSDEFHDDDADERKRYPWDRKVASVMTMLAPVLTPHGLLTLRQTGEALALEPEQGSRLEQAFVRGCGHGLLRLGADEVGTALPPVLSYWRELGARYVTALCALPGIGEGAKPPVPIPG